MAIDIYLAMTAAEMGDFSSFPPKTAWMACHFSPYGTGLTNIPRQLPGETLLILNDRTPMRGHDPERIAAQLLECLERWRCPGVLLDFQRPDTTETIPLAKHLAEVLPCPVGVSHICAGGLACPVFLPPVPPDVPVETYLSPWQGREVWLETALDGLSITLTPEGASYTPLPHAQPPADCYLDDALHCRCRITTSEEQARFDLYRTREDVDNLLEEATQFGVTTAVGLWQEFN